MGRVLRSLLFSDMKGLAGLAGPFTLHPSPFLSPGDAGFLGSDRMALSENEGKRYTSGVSKETLEGAWRPKLWEKELPLGKSFYLVFYCKQLDLILAVILVLNWVEFWASQVALVVKNLPANARDIRDMGLIPRSDRSLGGGHGNPLQYSCLDNPMDRGAWQATVHRVAKSWTWLNWLSMHTYMFSMCTYMFFPHHLIFF